MPFTFLYFCVIILFMNDATRKKTSEKAADVRGRALDLVTQNVYANQAPVGLYVPRNEEILAQAFQSGNRISRASFYRLWPTRGDLLNSVVDRLLDDDPYAANAVKERTSAVTISALGQVARGELEGGISDASPEVVSCIGRVLIESTNHVIASHVEAAVSSDPDLINLTGKLADMRGKYISTVERSLVEAHTLLGDTPVSGSAFRDYAENAAALARGIALSPAPAVQDHQDLHAVQFQALAQYFTR
jgi:AcrR family transcriptional regulator